ncbi:hypothetical protein RHMOL_Rhmol01G0225600 [Rhododendron molle]|uniref:Uncharacterized protein n=1 Tax=Rhododendron molle TaxID=49168 RepID=A0ACC0Q5N2_RHOML|nr:hypothetical protein RHMOL_Rhmol01G0225600 [Rhododendron molle]
MLAAYEAELLAVVEAREKEGRRFDKESKEVSRRTVVDEAVLAFRGQGPFNKATYMPLLHVVVSSLLEAYRPRRPTYDEALVLGDHLQHLSERRAEAIVISCYGGAADVLKFWERLPAAVKGIVREAGFGEFVGILMRASNDHQLVRALAKRWWDMTNSFHFTFSEMTVTPLDFSAITGLRVEDDPIPYNAEMGKDVGL